MLTIVTITKDDCEGAFSTIRSTKFLRESLPEGVRQLVIDSSAPQTGCLIQSSLAGETSVVYLRQEPSGIAAAFNAGITESKGEWLWFLNGRDELHPGLDTDNLCYLLRHTRADVIVFEMEFMQSGERYRHPALRDLWPPVYNWIPHPATIIRRKVFETYGLFDESFRIAMDGEFWFRALGGDLVVDTVSIPLVRYDESGISSCNPRPMAEEVLRILRRYLPSLIKGWLSEGRKIGNAYRYFKKMSKSATS